MGMNLKGAAFEGWRRENGRMGVRNHVIILPVDDLSNAAAEAVANNIKGALAIPHARGRYSPPMSSDDAAPMTMNSRKTAL